MRAVSITGTGEAEPLLFAAGTDAIKSVAIDASTVPVNAAGRRTLPAGTLLTKVAGASPTGKAQYQKYTGTGKIEGVLALDFDAVNGSSNSDSPRGMFYHGCVFRASKIVDYSLYGLTAASTLNTCKFELV